MGFTTIKSKHLAASGTITLGSSRIKSVYVVHGAGAGIVDIKDGGAAGTTVATINTMAGVGEYQIEMPEPGIRCTEVSTGSYALFTGGVSFVTIFYD